MRRFAAATILLALAILTSGCRGTGSALEGPLPVEIQKVDMLQLESFPVQIVLHVEGWLPNPCSDLEWEVEDADPAVVVVELYAVPQDVEACIQVLAPFEVNIPLGAVEGRQILLNGEDASLYPAG